MRHISPISGVAAYRDQYVATAGYDNLVILWDGHTKVPIHRTFHDHLANQCSFSSCGRYLVTSSSDYTARLWEVPTLRLQAVYSGHDDDVEMAAFNDQGNLVATCSRDHNIRIFALDGALQSKLCGHEADVLSVCWEQESDHLISSSDDGTVRKWDVKSGQLLETIDFDDVETDTIAITESGVIFAGNDAGAIIVVKDGVTHHIPAHNAGIKRLVYNADKRILVSLSYDRQVKVWAVSPDAYLSKIRTSDLPTIVWPRSCAFFGDHKLVFGTFGSVFAIYDYVADVWNTDGIEPSISLNATVYSHNNLYSIGDAGVLYRDNHKVRELGSLCNFLLPFGDLILTGGQMGQLFNAVNGQMVYQHRSPLNCGATFVKDGLSHAIVGAYTGEGIVFRQDGEGTVRHVDTIQLHDNAIKGLACSENKK